MKKNKSLTEAIDLAFSKKEEIEDCVEEIIRDELTKIKDDFRLGYNIFTGELTRENNKQRSLSKKNMNDNWVSVFVVESKSCEDQLFCFYEDIADRAIETEEELFSHLNKWWKFKKGNKNGKFDEEHFKKWLQENKVYEVEKVYKNNGELNCNFWSFFEAIEEYDPVAFKESTKKIKQYAESLVVEEYAIHLPETVFNNLLLKIAEKMRDIKAYEKEDYEREIANVLKKNKVLDFQIEMILQGEEDSFELDEELLFSDEFV